MSKHISLTLLVIGLCVAFGAAGCQAQATPTPQATPTDNVVVVVVTATTQPTIEATEVTEPTITPLATFTPIGTLEATATTSPTVIPTRKAVTAVPNTPSAPKPARTNTPTGIAAATATTAPLQLKFPAPTPLRPTTGDSHRDGSDIPFSFAAVGPLGASECYLLFIQMVNQPTKQVAGDFFLDTAHCGDQSPAGKTLTFTLFRPTFHNVPTYGTIEQNAQTNGRSDLLKLDWFVRVVQNNGPNPDGVHYNTTPLSPNSATLESDFLP